MESTEIDVKETREVGKLTDFPRHKENPFLDDFFPRTKGKIVARSKNKAIVDMVTGELQDTLFIGIKKEVEKEEFVKIFQSSLQELFGLNKATLKVLSYFMSVTEFNDKIIFDLEQCKTYINYKSTQTIFKGLRELVDRGIIAKSIHTSIYFINPTIFYKGDRLTIIKQYHLKKAKQVDKNQASLPFENE